MPEAWEVISLGTQWLEQLKEEPLHKWLAGSIVFLAVVIVVVSYLGGAHHYIPYRTGVSLTVIAAIPVFGITAVMFIVADRKTRLAYGIRILLAIVFVAFKYAWKYV